MTDTINSIKVEIIPGDYRYVRVLKNWKFYSDVLGRWCRIPAGFVFDLESVPLLKGTNPEAGAVHDYVCRIDSDPVCTKTQAARIYLEFQRYYDNKESGAINRAWDGVRRLVKTAVVWVAPFYFHKFKVLATYEEITGS